MIHCFVFLTLLEYFHVSSLHSILLDGSSFLLNLINSFNYLFILFLLVSVEFYVIFGRVLRAFKVFFLLFKRKLFKLYHIFLNFIMLCWTTIRTRYGNALNHLKLHLYGGTNRMCTLIMPDFKFNLLNIFARRKGKNLDIYLQWVIWIHFSNNNFI